MGTAPPNPWTPLSPGAPHRNHPLPAATSSSTPNPSAGVKTIFDLGEQEEEHALQEGTQSQWPCSTGDSFGCVSSSAACSLGQEELLPAMTHFTHHLPSKAKFGEFGVYHHCFDPETPEDVMGASVEQPWAAQGRLGRARAVSVVDFHTITVSENFWKASPLSKTKLLAEASSASQFLKCFYLQVKAGGLAVFVFGNVCTFG